MQRICEIVSRFRVQRVSMCEWIYKTVLLLKRGRLEIDVHMNVNGLSALIFGNNVPIRAHGNFLCPLVCVSIEPWNAIANTVAALPTCMDAWIKKISGTRAWARLLTNNVTCDTRNQNLSFPLTEQNKISFSFSILLLLLYIQHRYYYIYSFRFRITYDMNSMNSQYTWKLHT